MMITIPHLAAVLLAVVACTFDLKTRRIPNALTFGAAGLALVYNLLFAEWHGLLLSAEGLIVGFLLLLPLFALRGMGAGDVKLLAAIGAWIGPWLILQTALYGAIAGGVLAIVVGLYHGYMRHALSNILSLLLYWRTAGVKPMPALTLQNASGPRLAYALPIAVGMVISLWMRP